MIRRGLSPEVFAAPLEVGEIESVFESVGIEPPQDVLALYSWHDGYVPGVGPPFRYVPTWELDALARAAQWHTELRVLADVDIHTKWPVASGSEGFLLVDLRTGLLAVLDVERLVAVEPPARLVDLANFWADLYERHYLVLAESSWFVLDEARLERDYGTRDLGSPRVVDLW